MKLFTDQSELNAYPAGCETRFSEFTTKQSWKIRSRGENVDPARKDTIGPQLTSLHSPSACEMLTRILVLGLVVCHLFYLARLKELMILYGSFHFPLS